MLHTKIVNSKKEKILTSNAEKFIKDSKFGASIYFLGTVRNINDNKTVTGITYDSHDEMVIKSFEEIKKRSPIWKKEHYENEDSAWLKGNPINNEKV